MTDRRLDAELVARGLARSRARAAELIRERVVLVDDRVVAKASHVVTAGSTIALTRPDEPWVGRAALKLLRALDLWPIEVAGRRCLDVGASTGGFTQVLLQHDAGQVTALDVGHGQLAPSIAADPRVVNLEGANIREVDPSQLGDPFDLVVCDLSFISLALALPPMRALLASRGDLVVLVKPQFEVGRERLSRTGVVTSRHEHRRVLQAVHATATQLGLAVRGAAPSPIKGANGNREFLLWLVRAPGQGGLDVDGMDVDEMLDTIDREEEEP